MSKEYGVKVKYGTKTEEHDGNITSKEYKATIRVESSPDCCAELSGYWRDSKEKASQEAHEMLAIAIMKNNRESKHVVVNGSLYYCTFEPIVECGNVKNVWRVYTFSLSETGRLGTHYVGTIDSYYAPYASDLAEWLSYHTEDLPANQCDVVRKSPAPALALVSEA